jgi:DNA-binding NarL/FixJ family response regulator
MALRVFLVEDSVPVRERLQAMLAALDGARVVGHAEAADGALHAILAAAADVVVLDVKLAQGSGFDVLHALREAAPQVEVYMLSNFASAAYRNAAERLGARGFFDKTNEFEALRAVLAARAQSEPG